MSKFRSMLAMVALFAAVALWAGCKSGPSDEELKASITTAVAATPGVTVNVAKGVATLAGEVADDIAKKAAEDAAKAVVGVKSVTNNLTVKPVVINPDVALTTAVNTVLSTYKGISADVKDGIVTLRGEIKKADLQKLMELMQGLNPKKVENQLSIK